MKFEVTMAVSNKIIVFWDVIPCNFVAWYPDDQGSRLAKILLTLLKCMVSHPTCLYSRKHTVQLSFLQPVCVAADHFKSICGPDCACRPHFACACSIVKVSCL